MFSIKSKITIKLLKYFFINPDVSEYLNELSRILDLDSGNLNRKIKELENEGIFISEMKGNQKYYSLNKKYPLLKEIKRMIEVKYGLKDEIAKILEQFKGLKEAYFFGSYANDTLQQESDIDLLIIGSHKSRDTKDKILTFQKTYKRDFNIIDMTENELNDRKSNNDPFIKNIFSGKTIKII